MRIDWWLMSAHHIDADTAREHQYQNGKHPAGYGFYGFECIRQEDGNYRATWWCSTSCD